MSNGNDTNEKKAARCATIQSGRLRTWSAHLHEPAPARSGRVHTRRGVEIEITLDNGNVGRGDISPLAGLHRESLEEAIAGAEATFGQLRGLEVEACGTEGLHHLTPSKAVTEIVDERLLKIPSASWGMTCAILEATGAFEVTPESARAVLIADDLDSLEAQIESAGRALAAKAKLPRDASAAVERVHLLRERIGPQVELRFDCGRAYGIDDARRVIAAVDEVGGTFVEEVGATLEDNIALAAEGPVAVALDESLFEIFDTRQDLISDIDDVLGQSAPTPAKIVIAMKPAWLGAKRTRALSRFARDRGLPIVVSSVYEPPFARRQLAQIQRALDPYAIGGLARGWDLDCVFGERQVELVR